MKIEEALAVVTSELKAASEKSIKPSIRVSEKDWVCTIEDKHRKFVAIAKEEELVLVSMKSNEVPPDVTRIRDPEYHQASFIERIKERINEGDASRSAT